MSLSAALDVSTPETLAALPPELALQPAARLLSRLVEDTEFQETKILPLLQNTPGAKEWYVAYRQDAPDGLYSLQVFVWPPGSWTEIHDHSSWGVYRCVVGSVLEERYERLDDGSVPEHAHLRRVWQLGWAPEDGVSTVLPGDGGIHRVSNPGESMAISVHLYGPRMGEIDGRDYDPACDYVCDRQ